MGKEDAAARIGEVEARVTAFQRKVPATPTAEDHVYRARQYLAVARRLLAGGNALAARLITDEADDLVTLANGRAVNR